MANPKYENKGRKTKSEIFELLFKLTLKWDSN